MARTDILENDTSTESTPMTIWDDIRSVPCNCWCDAVLLKYVPRVVK